MLRTSTRRSRHVTRGHSADHSTKHAKRTDFQGRRNTATTTTGAALSSRRLFEHVYSVLFGHVWQIAAEKLRDVQFGVSNRERNVAVEFEKNDPIAGRACRSVLQFHLFVHDTVFQGRKSDDKSKRRRRFGGKVLGELRKSAHCLDRTKGSTRTLRRNAASVRSV